MKTSIHQLYRRQNSTSLIQCMRCLMMLLKKRFIEMRKDCGIWRCEITVLLLAFFPLFLAAEIRLYLDPQFESASKAFNDFDVQSMLSHSTVTVSET